VDLTAPAQRAELARLPEVAFYHPWPPLDGRPIGAWLKSMLLFFDGVAVVVAREDRHILVRGQEETILPLEDAGLLHVLDPDDIIEPDVATALTEFVLEIATSDERELLRDPDSPRSQALLRPRWVEPKRLSDGERAASKMVWEEMRRRGYVSRITRDQSVYLNFDAWAAILAFLAQALRPAGQARGLDLLPATDNPALLRGFRSIVQRQGRRGVVSRAEVVGFDLEQVAVDLSQIPIDDVLAFRQRHGADYQRYSTTVRTFVDEVGSAPGVDRAELFRSRRDELAAEADRLTQLARTWWRRPVASVSMGLAGGVWAGANRDWSTAALSLLAGIVGAGGGADRTSAYSYLFRTQSRFGARH
jgi:hypothetical protein